MTDVSDHIEDQDPAVYTSNGSLTSERGVMRTSSSVLVEEMSTEPYLNRHHYGLDILVSGVVLGLGIASVVLPWGSSSNDHSLAAVPGDLPYILPLLVVLTAAVLLSIFRVTRRSCYVILVIAGLWWADYLLGDLVSTVEHMANLDNGAFCAVIGAALAFAYGLYAWIRSKGHHLGVSPSSLIWAAVTLLLAVCWVAGDWLPRYQGDLHSTSGALFANGSQDLVWRSYPAFHNGTTLSNVDEALSMGLIVVLVVVVSFLLPPLVAATSVISVGVLYLSKPAFFVYTIVHDHPTPQSVGVTANMINTYHPTVTVTALWGGWMLSGAACAIVTIGVFRLLDVRQETDYLAWRAGE